MIHQVEDRVDHLAQVVGRDIRRHAHGDAAAAVDEEIGETRRENRRFAVGAVVGVLEIDSVAVEVLEQSLGDLLHAHFGVAHGRRHIAVDRAEVALAVDQRGPQRELLRHAHEREVDSLIAVRMILGDDVADDGGRLAVRSVPAEILLVH